MSYDANRQHYVFFSRSNAARDAMRRGIRSFETMEVPAGQGAWTYEIRRDGPGIEYALDYAKGKDWIAWVELTELEVPLLIISCLIEEIDEVIPDLFGIRPITPELWEELPQGARRKRRARLLPLDQPEAGEATPAPRPRRETPSGEPKPKAVGAKAIVREVFREMPGASKAEIITACVARGVPEQSAKGLYYHVSKE